MIINPVMQRSVDNAFPSMEKSESAKKELPQANDSIETGESEKSGFWSDIKGLITNNVRNDRFSYYYDYSDPIASGMIGGVVGGGIGFIAGGIKGYMDAASEIDKVPIQSKTMEWDVPVTQSKVIGQIPNDYYQHYGFSSSLITMKDVSENVPVIGTDGKPVMAHQARTWSDHGTAEVSFRSLPINNPVLNGYNQNIQEDYHYKQVCSGHDSNGNDICQQEKVMDGLWYRFSPNINYNQIGTYRSPIVSFHTGVDVFGKTITTAFLGLGAGAVSGAIILAIVDKISGGIT